ncbi:MAG: neutral zinc metallopeptidase [Novosphingobium sp.]
MRLDDFDPRNINVEDQRGSGFSLGGAGGRVGCGSIVIALIAALVFGVDPGQMLGTMQGSQSGPVATQGGTSSSESCSVDQVSRESCNALSSLNKTWTPLFAEAKIPFTPPKLVFYSQAGQSGCGAAQSAMGPFYCPSDQGIYLDTDFYRELEQRLGAGGDFARAYVIAHEYGHHVQTLTGVSEQVGSAQQANPQESNRLQVAMELQADCYAGVWAAHNRDKIEPGDIEEGLNAAHSIGDDVLTGGRVAESSFTHGSAAQRMEWLRKGLESGDEDQCDTFAAFRR